MATSSVSVMANSLVFARYDPHEDYHLAVSKPFRWFRKGEEELDVDSTER